MSAVARRSLERLVRSGLTPQRVARRARIVLLCDEGVSDREVSRRLGTHRHTVAVWRKRFEEGGNVRFELGPRVVLSLWGQEEGRRVGIALVAARLRVQKQTPFAMIREAQLARLRDQRMPVRYGGRVVAGEDRGK